MEEIYKLGISENTIKSMLELNPEINNMESKEIQDRIMWLKYIKCTDNQIRNIISSNPMYLSITLDEIIELLKKLYDLRFNHLNVLLDANPYILNINTKDLDSYIGKRVNNKEYLENIIDDLESHPYKFNDIL